MARRRIPRGVHGPRDVIVGSHLTKIQYFNCDDRTNGTMKIWAAHNGVEDPGSHWQRLDFIDGTVFAHHSDGFPMTVSAAKGYIHNMRIIELSQRKFPGGQGEEVDLVDNNPEQRKEVDATVKDAVLGVISSTIDRVIVGVLTKENLHDPDNADGGGLDETRRTCFPTETTNNDGPTRALNDDIQPAPSNKRLPKLFSQVEYAPVTPTKEVVVSPSPTENEDMTQQVQPGMNEEDLPSLSRDEDVLQHEQSQLKDFGLTIDKVEKDKIDYQSLVGRFISLSFMRITASGDSLHAFDIGRLHQVWFNKSAKRYEVVVDFCYHTQRTSVPLLASKYRRRVNFLPSQEGQWRLLLKKEGAGHINDIGYRNEQEHEDYDHYYISHPLLHLKHIQHKAPESYENLSGRRIQIVCKYDAFPGYSGSSGCLIWCTGTIKSVSKLLVGPKKGKRTLSGRIKDKSVEVWQATVLFDKRPSLEEPTEGGFILNPDLYKIYHQPNEENKWRLLKKDVKGDL